MLRNAMQGHSARATMRCRPRTLAPSLRRLQSGGPFQAMRPPSPEELGAPRRAKEYRRGRQWARRLLLTCALGDIRIWFWPLSTYVRNRPARSLRLQTEFSAPAYYWRDCAGLA
ncbi:hypothetical protein LB505_010749 [Fusarium chuoi]|nr:hypothetical protein LB505_010749 [Fusarium chuoi]